ncbi:hypothetical protein SDC9_50041 [bioreactor metagenome]|uniref:Uncharacterized protein n=1 Tax=bioreactor metagenome TaxID=1076179 RepID=A0A644WNG6_9ZZZZ|nr:hypothetical protein [Paludibacter sp.]
MKLFVFKVIKISAIVIFLLLVLTVINSVIINYSNILVLDKSDNILILGDSQSKYAINDKLLNNVCNFSDNADSYFYSYLKLKKIKNKNPQIDTLLLSFSEHNIASYIEDRWLFNDTHLKSRLMFYYPLLDFYDVLFLLKEKPKSFVLNSFMQILSPLYYYQKGNNVFGGYANLNRNNFNVEKQKFQNKSGSDNELVFAESFYEKLYLDKIKEYCDINDITLIFISTPIHKVKRNSQNILQRYCKEKYQDVTFLDYSGLDMQDNYFADLVHLNPKGSYYFTNLIKDNGFVQFE